MCAGTIQWVVDNPDRTRSHVPTYFTDHVPSSPTHRDRQFVLKIPTHSRNMMSKMWTMAPSSMAGHTGGRCDVSSLPIGEALVKEGVHMASPAAFTRERGLIFFCVQCSAQGCDQPRTPLSSCTSQCCKPSTHTFVCLQSLFAKPSLMQ